MSEPSVPEKPNGVDSRTFLRATWITGICTVVIAAFGLVATLVTASNPDGEKPGEYTAAASARTDGGDFPPGWDDSGFAGTQAWGHVTWE